MNLGTRDLHFEEDGRCGECFEEWPCRVWSKGTVRSAVYEWQNEAEIRQRKARMAMEEAKCNHVNELFDKLGYPMMRYPMHSSTMTLSREQITTILERLVEAEKL